jgi:hypothetical protein
VEFDEIDGAGLSDGDGLIGLWKDRTDLSDTDAYV